MSVVGKKEKKKEIEKYTSFSTDINMYTYCKFVGGVWLINRCVRTSNFNCLDVYIRVNETTCVLNMCVRACMMVEYKRQKFLNRDYCFLINKKINSY